GHVHELATFEFDTTIHPRGYQYLTDFTTRNSPHESFAQWRYTGDDFELTKRLTLTRGANELHVDYTLHAPRARTLRFELLPLVAMRDFHGATRAFDGGFPVTHSPAGVTVETPSGPRLQMSARTGNNAATTFLHAPDWWRNFKH